MERLLAATAAPVMEGSAPPWRPVAVVAPDSAAGPLSQQGEEAAERLLVAAVASASPTAERARPSPPGAQVAPWQAPPAPQARLAVVRLALP
jgi:hypothetical protein